MNVAARIVRLLSREQAVFYRQGPGMSQGFLSNRALSSILRNTVGDRTPRTPSERQFQPAGGPRFVARAGLPQSQRLYVEHLWPDLVILDILLPGIDGLEACRLLR
jgi:CheY-like chemotaxis protein